MSEPTYVPRRNKLSAGVRRDLEKTGVMRPEPRGGPRGVRVQILDGKLDRCRRALFIIPHGLGDCVLFSIVLRNLQAAFPKLVADVQCRREWAGVFGGLAGHVYAMEDETPERVYELEDRVPFFMPPVAYPNCPANKPSRYLIETLGINPPAGLCGYQLWLPTPAVAKVDEFLGRPGRVRAMLLHHQGETLKERKDLPEEAALAAIAAARRAGVQVYLLDLKGESPISASHGVRVIKADSALWGGDAPDPMTLLALAERVSLCVGIDSGPGHLFGCSNTRTLIVWDKHHPANHYALAHNVKHLVPEGLKAAGETEASRAFFDGWYEHATYARPRVGETLADEIAAALTLDRKRAIRVTVAQGLGDILWTYKKLAPHYDRIDLELGQVNWSDIESRSLEWCKLLPKAGTVTRRAMALDDYNAMAVKRRTLADAQGEWELGPASVGYSMNGWLEDGTRLEEIDAAAVEAFVPLKTEPCEIPWLRYITLAVSAGTKNVRGVWTVEQWRECVNLLYERYAVDLPIVLLGAEFDRAVCEEMAKLLTADGYQTHVLIGRPPARVADAMSRSAFHVGYQSGLNILADNYDVPQWMLYFDWLPTMGDSWVKPGNRERFSWGFFKESPDEFVSRAWTPFARRTGDSAMLCTWGIGDFLAVYSFMPPRERTRMTTLYWANRHHSPMRELIGRALPNVRRHVELFRDYGDADTELFCFRNLGDMKAKLKALGRKAPDDAALEASLDLNMERLAWQIGAGERRYQGMGALVDTELADIRRFALPANYVAIHPYSDNARKTFRDLSPGEWRATLSYLKRHGRVGVVINYGPHLAPEHPNIIDLSNRLTLLEAMEVVRRASGFIGCASCFSVLASKRLTEAQMFVKCHPDLGLNWWRVYYAPLQQPTFLYRDLMFLASFVEPDPWYRYAASLSDGNPYGSPDGMLELYTEYGAACQSNLRSRKVYGRSYWDEYARRDGTLIGRRIMRARADLVEKHCDGVLDFGIGSGAFIRATTAAAWGYDINPVGVAWLKERGLYFDFWNYGLPAGVDALTAFDVIEHLPRPTELLWRIPAGKLLIVTVPFVKDLKSIRTSKHYKPGEHLWMWTVLGFEKFARAIGFDVIEHTDMEIMAGREDVTTFVLKRLGQPPRVESKDV